MPQTSATISEPLAGDHPGPIVDHVLRQSLAGFPFDLQTRLYDAHRLHEVYEIGVAMLARIPATVGARIFQRNDQGSMVVVHSWRSPFSTQAATGHQELGQAIHQHWLAAHRVGKGMREFARPFTVAEHPGWLLVPMLAGDELIGGIAAERRDGATFSYAPEDIVAFAAAAAAMAWSIQSIFLRGRTNALSDRERREDIIQQERREIGRELHDTVVQDLAYINLKIELAERCLAEDAKDARGELQAARDILERAITEFRRTIGELRRPQQARHGITGQLRSLVTTMETDTPALDVDFRQISGVQLVPEVERAVVGIVREALQNVRKHSNAQAVKLEVRRADDELRVFVADDGVGIQEQPGRPHSFGMELMRELAEDLGGELRIVSGAGQGTQIQASLPLVLPKEVESGSAAVGHIPVAGAAAHDNVRPA